MNTARARSRSRISARTFQLRGRWRFRSIVHTRDAEDDTIGILREEMGQGAFTGLIHCFTGTERLADAAFDLGLYISASASATFKKSDALRAVLRACPRRLLVETDAPYLAPVPIAANATSPPSSRIRQRCWPG